LGACSSRSPHAHRGFYAGQVRMQRLQRIRSRAPLWPRIVEVGTTRRQRAQ